MWGRVLQIFVAAWLAASPWIFGHDSGYLFAHDLVSASIIALLALISFAWPLRHLHVLSAIPAIWMIAAAFVRVPSPPPPAYQNHVILGLFLLILLLVPSQANRPPQPWRDYYEGRSATPLGRD